MTPKIHPTPPMWCPGCGLSSRADMIGVAVAPKVLVCGDCVIEAAALVIVEQERRAASEAAKRGEASR